MMLRKLSLFSSISALVLMAACSSNPPSSNGVYSPPAASTQGLTFGNVSRIDTVSRASSTSGGGAVLGAVLGGVLGHQVGGGSGKDAATAVGVVGGALIGNEVEKRNKDAGSNIYRITVRLDNGSTAQFEYERIDDLRVGDRVKVQDGQLYRV